MCLFVLVYMVGRTSSARACSPDMHVVGLSTHPMLGWEHGVDEVLPRDLANALWSVDIPYNLVISSCPRPLAPS